MSWLSDRTGIHINSINDVTSGRALKQAVSNPLLLAAAAPFALPALGGAIGAIPGLGGVGSAIGGALGGGGLNAVADASNAGGLGSSILGRLGLSGKDLIGVAGGVLGGIQDQRNQDANRNQSSQQFQQSLGLQQQQFGLQQRQYEDALARQRSTSAALSPVIQRLLGQWGGGDVGQMLAPHPAPAQPQQIAAHQIAAPAPMTPSAPQPVPAPMQPPAMPQQDPRKVRQAVMSRVMGRAA